MMMHGPANIKCFRVFHTKRIPHHDVKHPGVSRTKSSEEGSKQAGRIDQKDFFLCQKNGLMGLKGPSTGTVKKCEKPKDFHGGGTNEE